MKWLTAAKVLFVFIILVLMTGAQSSGSNGNYDGIISVFNTVRVLHYSAAVSLTVSKVHATKDATVKEGDPIVSFDYQGRKGTIRAPHPVTIDNMYVSEGQEVGASGHLFDAALSPEHAKGQAGDEEARPAGPPVQDYLLFK